MTSDVTKVAGLSVAKNRNWTDRDGQVQERTEWHRVVAWDNLADLVEQYLSRGDSVYIEGEIQYRSYADRDGATRYLAEIRAWELVMLGGQGGGAAEFDRLASARARYRLIARSPRKSGIS